MDDDCAKSETRVPTGSLRAFAKKQAAMNEGEDPIDDEDSPVDEEESDGESLDNAQRRLGQPATSLCAQVARLRGKGGLITVESLATLCKILGEQCAKRDNFGEESLEKQVAEFSALLLEMRAIIGAAASNPAVLRLDELTDAGFEEVVETTIKHLTLNQCVLRHPELKVHLDKLQSLHLDELNKWRARQSEIASTRQRCKQGLEPMSSDAEMSSALQQLLAPLLPDAAEYEAKKQVVQTLQEIARQRFPKATMRMFGSAANHLGFKSSDVDVCLGKANQPSNFLFASFETVKDCPFATVEEYLASLHSNESRVICGLADLMSASGQFSEIVTIATARVPLVKAVHKATGFHVDVAMGNELGLENTALLATYAEVDVRVRHLLMLVKLWAKNRKLADASNGFLSSYGWIILCLHFLQNVPAQLGGAVVPNLQTMQKPDVYRRVQGYRVAFVSDVNRIRGAAPQSAASLAGLFRGFFAYLAMFDVEHTVISISKKTLERKNLAITPAWRISIIDPFELRHDLGSKLSGRRASNHLFREVERSCLLLCEGKVAECFAEVGINPIEGRLCHLCGYAGHQAKACELDAGANYVKPCFDCGQVGHISRHCPKRACRVCGKAGHIARDCPLKSRRKKIQQPDNAVLPPPPRSLAVFRPGRGVPAPLLPSGQAPMRRSGVAPARHVPQPVTGPLNPPVRQASPRLVHATARQSARSQPLHSSSASSPPPPLVQENVWFATALHLVVERQLGSPAQMPALLELAKLAGVLQLPVRREKFANFCKSARPKIFNDDGSLANSLFDLISSHVAARALHSSAHQGTPSVESHVAAPLASARPSGRRLAHRPHGTQGRARAKGPPPPPTQQEGGVSPS